MTKGAGEEPEALTILSVYSEVTSRGEGWGGALAWRSCETKGPPPDQAGSN